MNYIRHLTGFFERAAKDFHLNPTHISLYISIFQLWNLNRFKSPLSVSRSELMALSKVGSKTTYHKCMKELQQFGYIRYDPSYHPLRGSWVHLFDFTGVEDCGQSKICPGAGQVPDRQWPSDEQDVYKLSSGIQASKEFQSPLNISKHIKHNKLSFCPQTENLETEEKEKKEVNSEKIDLPAAVEISLPADLPNFKRQAIGAAEKSFRKPAEKSPQRIPEAIEQVTSFFIESGYEEDQAVKFFHYFSATGWKVGGRSPIENWHAAAHSWILNSQNLAKNGKSTKPGNSAGKLHTNCDKNYSEPL